MTTEYVTVKKSRINGLGVFASKDFIKGERILVGDESRVVTPENSLRPENGEFERHCDYLAGGKVVLLGWPERHINHSCDPNAHVAYVNNIRGTYARRNIRSGEEITHDYCINGFGDFTWECNCHTQRCRKIIHSDFFHLPLDLQIEYLPLLADWYVEEYRERIKELNQRIQKNAAFI